MVEEKFGADFRKMERSGRASKRNKRSFLASKDGIRFQSTVILFCEERRRLPRGRKTAKGGVIRDGKEVIAHEMA